MRRCASKCWRPLRGSPRPRPKRRVRRVRRRSNTMKQRIWCTTIPRWPSGCGSLESALGKENVVTEEPHHGVGGFFLLRRAGNSGLLLQPWRSGPGEVCPGQGCRDDAALEPLFAFRAGCRSGAAHRNCGGGGGAAEFAEWIGGGSAEDRCCRNDALTRARITTQSRRFEA